MQSFWRLFKTALEAADHDGIPRLGAALSFYTLFSLAPLLLVATAAGGAVFGAQAARSAVVDQVRRLVGDGSALLVESLLENVSLAGSGVLPSIVGFLMFLLGATAAFVSLQGALNTVWNVRAPPRPLVRGFLRKRFLSLMLVIGVGILALLGLVASAVLGTVGSLLPGIAFLWYAADFLTSVVGATLFFAMIYKVLPDVDLAWGDVWRGAAVTAVFFVVGKTLVGWYLGSSGVGSVYGAAGSVVAILLWVYYSSQTVLLGAEFTQAYVYARGSSPMPPPQ